MSERPNTLELRTLLFDDADELPKERLKSAIAVARCRPKRHLMAAVLGTPSGPILVWRDWKPPRQWLPPVYVDEADPIVETGCACLNDDHVQRYGPTKIDPEWLARQRGHVVR